MYKKIELMDWQQNLIERYELKQLKELSHFDYITQIGASLETDFILEEESTRTLDFIALAYNYAYNYYSSKTNRLNLINHTTYAICITLDSMYKIYKPSTDVYADTLLYYSRIASTNSHFEIRSRKLKDALHHYELYSRLVHAEDKITKLETAL